MENLLIVQGDCILKKCGVHDLFIKEHKEIPDDAIELNTNLVLNGQTNSHALYGGEFKIYEKDGVKFIRVLKETTLDHVKDHKQLNAEHAEHHAQIIEVGDYFLDQVLEYDHLLEESRAIID